MTANAPRRSGRRLQLLALGVVAVVAWGAGLYFRLVPGRSAGARLDVGHRGGAREAASVRGLPSGGSASSLATGSASAAASAAGAASSATGGASAVAADASAVAAVGSASIVAPPADPAAITACVSELFAPHTFDKAKPDFSFVCTDSFPLRGVTRVQSQVALGRWGKGGMSEGMREWAALGWYQIAAYAVFRGHCCDSAPAYEWTFDLNCPLDTTLYQLERVAKIKDTAAMRAAMAEFDVQASCLTRLGQAPLFGQTNLPSAGSGPFARIVGRLR